MSTAKPGSKKRRSGVSGSRKKKPKTAKSPQKHAASSSKRGTRGRSGPLADVSIEALQAEFERRLAALQRRRDELTTELDQLEREIANFEIAPAPGRRATRPTRKRARNTTNLTEALRKILTDRTMSVSEMAEAVQAAGYRTTSPNFRTIVNQTLIGNPKVFKRVSRGKYTVKAGG
ncbi:MAG: hypothetical protein HKO59_07155 [Phycisphaerales bacterium]|nr:hypothetical protein [Phycisphaerae bacterium]NNF42592.1 hypothetical protein [Phycisphaerales bacterium]NNM25752.1 hypothetical protein [Phycisphaerales bacterium]